MIKSKIVQTVYSTFYEMNVAHSIRLCKENIHLLYSECSKCGRSVNFVYVYIIETLKDNNLLEEEYPILCCSCKVSYDRMQKFGRYL